MTNHEKRQRLIAMRECLREVQRMLPTNRNHGTPYICIQANYSGSSWQAQQDTKDYVMRALEGHGSFDSWMQYNNKRRHFGDTKIMTLRRRFIDDLCQRINQELEQLA